MTDPSGTPAAAEVDVEQAATAAHATVDALHRLVEDLKGGAPHLLSSLEQLVEDVVGRVQRARDGQPQLTPLPGQGTSAVSLPQGGVETPAGGAETPPATETSTTAAATPATDGGAETPGGGVETPGSGEAITSTDQLGRHVYLHDGDGEVDPAAWPSAGVQTPDGRALYFYQADAETEPGAAPLGDGLDGVWHLYTGPVTEVPPAGTAETPAGA